MRRLLSTLLFSLPLAAFAGAQMRMLPTIITPFPAGSGPIQNPTESTAAVWSEVVQAPGATSFRVEFGAVELPDPGDAVVIHNPLDGETQRLDQAALRRWGNRSAWFNGSMVVVSLELAQGSTGRVEVAWTCGIAPEAGADDLCGADNRVASADNRVFRLFLTDAAGAFVCTGFLVTPGAIYLSAGHCFGTSPVTSATAEFNVPLSSVIGTIVHPPVADQFPTDMTSVQFQDAGTGQDWAVGRLHPNINGANAVQTFGFFSLFATTWLGTFSNVARVTGYGADTSSPLMFNHFAQQTATGLHPGLNLNLTGSLSYVVDTDGGSSGSPVIQEDGGRIAGIHTHGTCASLGANQGTGIQNPQLQAAIAAAGGCFGMQLNTAPILVSCTPAAWSMTHGAGRWNVAGVSGPDDWNIFREATGSVSSGNACDFLLADGNLGTVPPASGMIRRASGTGNARAEGSLAQVLSLDQTVTTTWTSTRILKAFEFEVSTPGTTMSVAVAGDPALKWHLYPPNAGLGSAWRPRGQGLLVSGQVAGPPVNGIVAAAVGTYCLVLFRDGGPGTPNPALVSISVCATTAAPVALSPDVPVTLTANALQLCAPFTLTPAPGTFNAVGLSCSGDTALSLAQGASTTAGSATEIVIAIQDAAGSIPLTGVASAAPASAPAVIEHAVGQPVSLSTLISTSVPAGHALKLLSFSTSTSGNHDLLVTGDSSLRWYLFSGASPGVWRGRSSAIASGQVGGPGVTLNIVAPPVPLNYGLVVAREGGVASTSLAFQARFALATTHLTLAGPGSVASVTFASHQFTCTPPANRWTALGIRGSATNTHTISIGIATSSSGTSSTAYVVANGHLGTVAPVDGFVTRSGQLTHANSGALHQAAATAMAVGAPGSRSWGSSDLIHVFEFSVPATANYDINVAGVTGLTWALFDPGTAPVWRPKTPNLAAAAVGTARNGIFLAPGTHAIVVARSGSGTLSGTVTCSVAVSTNPVPLITGVVPAAVPAGSPSGTVLLDGTGFTALTTAAIDGGTPLAVVSQTTTQLVVAVPASLVQSPGIHAITAANPSPGGGTSAPVAFAVLAPAITAVAPAAIAPIPPGGLPVTITVDGAAFLPGAVVHAGTVPLPTTFVSAIRLTAIVGPTVPDAVFAGGMAITVENARTAQSNTMSVPVAPGGNNRGTIVRAPLDPLPNEHYVARLEGGVPGSLFSLLADLAYPAPVVHWPDTSGDMILRITSPTVLPLLDGFGLFGPAFPGAVYTFDPAGTAPGGVFTVPGFIWPAAPINFRLSMQTVHLDPGAFYGFNLGWPRTEDL